MSISMYQLTVPVFCRAIDNLDHILRKGAAHADNKKIDPAVLFQARLYPDMFPLSRQVQIVTDQVKGCVSRLAGLEPPRYEDNEKTFEELLARIEKTKTHVQSITSSQVDGSEDRVIKLTLGGSSMEFRGLDYVLNFVYPNLFFHAATTYGILRHNGVELGKRDFLGEKPKA